MFKYVVHSGHNYSGDWQIIFKFPNGFGASVIQGKRSLGGDRGLWEVAVLDKDGEYTNDTPVTADTEMGIFGYMDANEVQEVLEQIMELPNQ